uniref:ZAD domain-containing protein n=1 Tax=Musca domestica TaxID=7370 RepID=A0A1I8M312_MUSDO
MELQMKLEMLCRVCAANTKCKNSECVYILKTAGLCEKLDKFLYLKVLENDALPKILCKSCFRQVEATASLSKIAKDTEKVFRDFLSSGMPKGVNTTETAAKASINPPEYTSSDLLSKKDADKGSNNANDLSTSTSSTKSKPAGLTDMQSPPPPPPLPTPPTFNITPRKEDLVVNVSVSDPLTRENQQKMISNSQRRHSIMVDMASLGSLANITSNLAQLSQKNNNSPSTGHSSGRKSASPARVQKYCTIAPKPLLKTSQQPNQVTTFSSGGYVIEPLQLPQSSGGNTAEKEVIKKPTLPLTITATGVTPAITVTDNTILQQKRKNLVKALNNIKANSGGQVSLLKSSQPKQQQQSLLQSNQPAAKSLLVENIVKQVTDELPDRIIIAAPKNKAASLNKPKKPEDSNIPASLAASNPTLKPPSTLVISEVPAVQQPLPATVAQQPPPAAATQQPPKTSSFPEDILLGRVIKDIDLLKLILKALKWPVNKQNLELQLQRLKSTRFTDIMSDPNLLQDTDLTQLLGPYLAPVLLAAQALQQQQQQIMMNNNGNASKVAAGPKKSATTTTIITPTSKPIAIPSTLLLDSTKDEINKAIPYKLPPETSVQLVPALPDETEIKEIPSTYNTNSGNLKRPHSKDSGKSSAPMIKRQRKSGIQKHRDSIVISDEEDGEPPAATEKSNKTNARQRSNKLPNNYEIDLTNPSFLVQLGLLNGSSSEQANEALMALLAKQRMVKQQQSSSSSQRKRLSSISHNPIMPSNTSDKNVTDNASEFDALINIDDDIVLMEPVTTSSSSSMAKEEIGANKSVSNLPAIDISNFVMPQQLQNVAPIITRPIIKRRKTVIQSSKAVVKDVVVPTTTTAASSNAENSNKLEKDNATKKTSQEELPTTTTTANTGGNATPSGASSTETSPSKQGSRKQQNKAALGQQLLEAIGLQKIQTKDSSKTVHYASTSSTAANDVAPPAMGSKQSVQQIRSALKKSLKQAQEQQQQLRNKDSTTTIIQDADSTTKTTVKDIVIEHRSNKSMDSSSTHDDDIEEQIEKITLVKSANTVQETSTKDEPKKETSSRKKPCLSAGRITERRSTLPSSAGRVRFNLNPKGGDKEEEKKTTNSTLKKETDVMKAGQQEEKIKSEAESPNVSSTSSTTEQSQPKEEPTETPRRRGGRKRITEITETNDTSNHTEKESEKEKDNKPKETDKDNDKKKDKEKEKDKSKDAEKEKETKSQSSKAVDKIKEDLDETSSNSGRPTRQSKTLSKYYKGPDKAAASRRSLPARSTRNRKYC